MNNMKKIISTLLLAGVITGCASGGASTTAVTQAGSTGSVATSAQAGTTGDTGAATTAGDTTATSAGDTTAATVPFVTLAVDMNIILAEGDGIQITSGQVETEFNRMLNAYRQQYGDEMVNQSLGMLQEEKASILDQLTSNAILALKADELALPMESPEAVAQYDKIVADNLVSYGSQEKFEEAVASVGYTMESYRAEILKSLRFQALSEEVTKDIKVSAEEVKKAYEEQKETQFTQQPGATMYHIFFGKPDDATAEATAKEAKAKLDGGAKFSDIAQEYGQDASATSGGLLGAYPYDTQELGADFVAEAKKLSEGQISDPVKTSFGWHIIMVEDVKTKAKTFGLEDMLPMDDGSEKKVYQVIEDGLLTGLKNERMTTLMKEWETAYNLKSYPEKIPMNVAVEEEPASTTPGETTPAATGAESTTTAGTGAETTTTP